MPPRRTEASVTLSTGTVRGDQAGGVRRFLGLPFAAPPVAARRFAPPQPVDPWVHERDATRPGEDVLTVDVWAPAKGARLPVIVWVTTGTADLFDPEALARDGIVVVRVSFRTGLEGFAALAEAPLNLGLADQLAALRWLQREAAVFGGDPRAVTVAGDATGGCSVAALLALPDARQLMARAVVHAAPLAALPHRTAARRTRAVAKLLGVAATREALAGVDPAALLDPAHAVRAEGGGALGVTIGGELVPRDPEQALLTGAGRGVPLLVGSVSSEREAEGAPRRLSPARLLAAVARRPVGRTRPSPLHRLADARLGRGDRTWVYEVDGAGALAGPDAPAARAEAVHRTWVALVTTGEPGWAAWSPERPVRVFDDEGAHLTHAPREDERSARG